MARRAPRLVSPPASSENVRAVMRGNRARDTKPELIARRLLWSLGYRYRLHRADLPGKPDIVFAARKQAIFVHGCFWHQHKGRCPLARKLRSDHPYWKEKLARNVARDKRSRRALRALGWKILVVWECELRNPDGAVRRLRAFLKSSVTAKKATHARRNA